ncbi:MAG TPA: hypothetical protein PLE54_11630 [Burkholderiaceae bacterium]|nr:hypothetical protein [Burkholderiaceae bacterium]
MNDATERLRRAAQNEQTVIALNDLLREREARLAEAERKHLTAARALVKAFNELNAIRARDGVPRDYAGMKTGVSEEYFSSVVDDVDAAVLALTGLGAHCHPLLYERATDSATVGQDCQTLAALDSEDAARFRWLCDDHADKAIRHLRDSLLERMSVMSLSAIRAAIGIHLSNVSEQAKNSHHE